MIVVGYGGNDSSIMRMLRQIPNDLGLYWCNYGRSPLSGKASYLLRRANMFKVQTAGFDNVMDNLLHTIGFTLPDFDEVVQQQREAIVKIMGESNSPFVADYLISTEGALKATESTEPVNRIRRLRDRTALLAETAGAPSRGDLEAIILARRKLLEIDPGDIVILRELGSVLTESGELEEGLDFLKRANLNDPDDGFTLNALGLALLDDGQIDAGVALLSRANEQNPDNIFRLNSLAIGQYLQGQKVIAGQSFNEVIHRSEGDISGRETDLMNRAIALIGIGQISDGLVMIDTFSNTAINALNVLSALAEMKRHKKAGIQGADEAILTLENALNRFHEN